MSAVVADGTSLSGVLRGLSCHLNDLASEVCGIEDTIGEVLKLPSIRDAGSIARLQRLDYIRQSMEDLALLTMLLANDHDGAIKKSLAENLRLDATKRLIDGKPVSSNISASNDAKGVVDFF